ncbi:MAG TPA: ferredoxin--NADP reductase [Steroidobacteraceae bacterium]|nr:ferredoxin--NADP reductase [Steroidobacteraceae bacterium]
MAALGTERVLTVRHWTDTQFTFTTTRDRGLRFENGQFVMVGLAVAERPLLRAYSIASANHEEHLEFLSIKMPDGPLTSRLQHVRAGDEILVSRKPTGTLVLQDLRPGKRLYLLSTGTGAAPFMSVIKDPEVYERFEHIVFVHGVRWARETAVVRHQIEMLRTHELLGAGVRARLRYHPAVTREPHANRGRLTTLIEAGRLARDLGLPVLDPALDRVMVCGSQAMLTDTCALLDARGFTLSPHIGAAGDYLIERAFVTR